MKQFIMENKLDYYCKTSCKTYEGIEDMIYNLVDIYLKKKEVELKQKDKTKEENKKLNKKKNKKDCSIF